MKQLDLLRGNINPPFTDTELCRCHLRLFLVKELGPEVIVFSKNYKKAPEFVSPTNRLVLANTHNGMVRGDDIRSPLVTWAHKGILPMPKGNTFEENSYVFFLFKDTSKCNKNATLQLAGFLRHKDPLICPANAEGECIILSFGKGGARTMPDILDGSVNWMEDCWYLTDPSEKKHEVLAQEVKKK